MNEDVVEGHLRNHREDIHGAVFKILKDWRDSQSDFKIAFEKLCAALRHDQVNKRCFAVESSYPNTHAAGSSRPRLEICKNRSHPKV